MDRQTAIQANTETIARLKRRIADLPETRQARVCQLRRALREGRYRPSNHDIASALLAELLWSAARRGRPAEPPA